MDTSWTPNGVPEDATEPHYDDVTMETVRLASSAASEDTGPRNIVTSPSVAFIDDMDRESGVVRVEMPVPASNLVERVRLAAAMIASRSRTLGDMLGYPPCIIVATRDNADHTAITDQIRDAVSEKGNRSYQTVIIMTTSGCVALFPAYPGTSDRNSKTGQVTYTSARAIVKSVGGEPGVLKLRNIIAKEVGLVVGKDVELDTPHTAMWGRDVDSKGSLPMGAVGVSPMRRLNKDPVDRGVDMISLTDTFVFAERMSRMQRTPANLQRALVANGKDAVAFEMFMGVGVLGAASSTAPFNPETIAFPVSVPMEKIRQLFKKMSTVVVNDEGVPESAASTQEPPDFIGRMVHRDDDDDPDVITIHTQAGPN